MSSKFEPGQPVHAVRDTADVRWDVATVTATYPEVVVVEFSEGHRVHRQLIDGYVRQIPDGWTPERDETGHYQTQRPSMVDALASEEDH